jgi:hypothetical protein
MKKISTFILAALLTGFATQAQTDKEDWMVGGNLSINTTQNNSQFSLYPSAGYFFAKNFAAGTQIDLSFGKNGSTKFSTVGISPFARLYFDLKEDHFKPLIQSSFGVSSTSTKHPVLGNSTNTFTNFFIGGGGAYFINRNVAMDILAGYYRSKNKNFDANGGFSFRIGFQVHLLGNEVRETLKK